MQAYHEGEDGVEDVGAGDAVLGGSDRSARAIHVGEGKLVGALVGEVAVEDKGDGGSEAHQPQSA